MRTAPCVVVGIVASIFIVSYGKSDQESTGKPTTALSQATQPEKAPASEQTSPDENFRTWKGEKVILLSWYPGAEQAQKQFVPDCHLYGNPGAKLSAKDYVGMTGVISGLHIPERKKALTEYRVDITLDKTKERILVTNVTEPPFAFIAEMERAKSLLERPLWAKGVIELRTGLDILGKDTEIFRIQNTSKIVLAKAEWGHNGQPIIMQIKTEDGRTCYFHDPDPFLINRFHLYWFSRKVPLDTRLYLEDPQKMYPGWDNGIWEMIRKSEIAIGMTEEMARVASGGNLLKVGSLIDPEGKILPIYQNPDTGVRFFIESGKVSKYAVSN